MDERLHVVDLANEPARAGLTRTMAARGIALLLTIAAAGAPSAADVAQPPNLQRGMRLYLQCIACHDLKPATPQKIGPNLHGLMGRQAGAAPGSTASAALKASGIVWTAETLDRWLEKPSALVPGTTMAFAGVPKPEDRASLIAYIERESAPADAPH